LNADMVAARHRRNGTTGEMLREQQAKRRQLARDGYDNCPRHICQAIFRQIRQTESVCSTLGKRQLALRERLLVMLRKMRILRTGQVSVYAVRLFTARDGNG
jgi:hypothetical protein